MTAQTIQEWYESLPRKKASDARKKLQNSGMPQGTFYAVISSRIPLKNETMRQTVADIAGTDIKFGEEIYTPAESHEPKL